jgi:RNA polymerase sigma-70 factor (ECF subfamily)
MLSSFVDEVDKSGTAVPSFSASAGEEALVIAAKNGNDHAFETLVERYRRRMLAVALRLTRVQEDAEDITQQSFQKAFLHLREFEGKSSFSTWLTRIAINEALMFLRRSRRQRQVSIDDDSIDLEGAASRLEIPDSDPGPEASYLQREAARIVSAALDRLRPRLRKVIELRDLEELSTEETARRVGLSVSATKSRVLRGRRKLRETLRRYVRSPRMQLPARPDASRDIASPAPHVVKTGAKGYPYDDAFVDRCVGDPGFPLPHQP